MITKRILCQLYEREATLSSARAWRWVTLCRKSVCSRPPQLLLMCREVMVAVARLDPGWSQFRGFASWHLYQVSSTQPF